MDADTAGDLPPRLIVYWNAFWSLHGSRQASFGGALPISISEIKAYCDLCGFDDPIIRYEVMTMVQAMDSEWLAMEDNKRKHSPRNTGRHLTRR